VFQNVPINLRRILNAKRRTQRAGANTQALSLGPREEGLQSEVFQISSMLGFKVLHNLLLGVEHDAFTFAKGTAPFETVIRPDMSFPSFSRAEKSRWRRAVFHDAGIWLQIFDDVLPARAY
jgi:hypothetical protein